MLDSLGRNIDYLRISVTDRCNLHCAYCRPQNPNEPLIKELVPRLEHSAILRYEEIVTVCKAAVQLGITKFKLTGGEPLVRRDFVELVRLLKAVPGVEQVTMTTNGILLASHLQQLKELGIDGINISLDVCEPVLYNRITGGGELTQVLQNIDKAYALGLPIKLNCVPLRITRGGLLDIVDLVRHRHIPLRFIELMPLAFQPMLHPLTPEDVRCVLASQGILLEPDEQRYGNGPAVYYKAKGVESPIGFISALHNKFCGQCNRVRLTSTGFLKTCLYCSDGLDLRELLRSGAGTGVLAEAMSKAIYNKPMGHSFAQRPAGFNMNEIGG